MVSLLSESEFRKQLSTESRESIQDLLILGEIDSTNAYLQRRYGPEHGKINICMAEHQNAGKGRQGREWLNLYGGSLLYSASWMFNVIPKQFSALTLAVGVVVQEALTSLGYVDIKLKWPNDLLVGEAKLGGILLEAAQRQNGVHVVCGIGLNVLSGVDKLETHQKVISLQDMLTTEQAAGDLLVRTSIAAKITEGLIHLLEDYPARGFLPWLQRWQQAHVYSGQQVQVICPDRNVRGIAMGTDVDGAFLLQTGDRVERFISSEVSIRKLEQLNADTLD